MNLMLVFNKKNCTKLPPHHPYDFAIELIKDDTLPKSRIYPLTQEEERAMEEYVEEALAQGFIRSSTSPVVLCLLLLGSSLFFFCGVGAVLSCLEVNPLSYILWHFISTSLPRRNVIMVLGKLTDNLAGGIEALAGGGPGSFPVSVSPFALVPLTPGLMPCLESSQVTFIAITALYKTYGGESGERLELEPILPSSVKITSIRWEIDEEIEGALKDVSVPSQCPVQRTYDPESFRDRLNTWPHSSLTSGHPHNNCCLTVAGGRPLIRMSKDLFLQVLYVLSAKLPKPCPPGGLWISWISPTVEWV
ncbi:hypothetical protein NFI96_033079, partial [Prochilodus magdalenae]